MNFLAHVYLSGNDQEVATGNLIADRVKGKEIENYVPKIQKGILLHRKIDTFTDTHPMVRSCREELFPAFRHYSGVIVDMYFDHFLAASWHLFHHQPLADFSKIFFKALRQNTVSFPLKINKLVDALIRYNWFQYYETITGLEQILLQMEKRSSPSSNLAASILNLQENYDYFQHQFFSFMEEAIHFSKEELKRL